MDTATNVTPIKPQPAPVHRVSKFALKALVTFTRGPDRPNINRVFVSDDGSTMVATDGNALLLRHDPMVYAGGMRRDGSCITVDACKAAIKACPAGAEIVIDPSTGAISVEQGAHVLARIDGRDDSGYTFPPFWQVIPSTDRESTGGPFGLCGHLLAAMAGALTRGKRPRGGSLLRWSFGGPLDPVRVDVAPGTAGAVDDARWIGVLMPIRF